MTVWKDSHLGGDKADSLYWRYIPPTAERRPGPATASSRRAGGEERLREAPGQSGQPSAPRCALRGEGGGPGTRTVSAVRAVGQHLSSATHLDTRELELTQIDVLTDILLLADTWLRVQRKQCFQKSLTRHPLGRVCPPFRMFVSSLLSLSSSFPSSPSLRAFS